jgi:hypothetical protein
MRRGARTGHGACALVLVALLALAPTNVAVCCDVCAIYTATEMRETRAGMRLGVWEQWSQFGTERLGGTEVTLPAEEHMDSSVTQFLVGYTLTPRLGIQLTVPYVDRSFTRIRDHRLEEGTERGIGDVALLGNVLAYSTVVGDSTLRFTLFGGVKFPTGDSSRLGEEFVEPETGRAQARSRTTRARLDILPLEGGLHGHDLALGSGSFDGVTGGQLFWSWRRLFVGAIMQYAIRSTGDFDYRYANDLTWVGGPGVFALLTHRYSVALQGVLSGETKGKDSQQGRTADDTAMTALYAGPGLSATWGTSFSGEVTVDLPVIQHNTGLQLVPDIRVRGGFTWRF